MVDMVSDMVDYTNNTENGLGKTRYPRQDWLKVWKKQ